MGWTTAETFSNSNKNSVFAENCGLVSGVDIKVQLGNGSHEGQMRITCYGDTTAELGYGFNQNPTFNWDDVDGTHLAEIFGLGLFFASSVYIVAWGCGQIARTLKFW
ncbi:hypothetical protein N9Y40_02820 [Porticoccaceae bacterium]|nr:hypothetical protein [Porticoccaceae bacterium]